MEFIHIHSSSRFDRSPESLKYAAKKYNAYADLTTYTEVDGEAREGALKEANGSKFILVAGDKSHKNDCAIVFKDRRFRLIYKEQFKATSLHFKLAGHTTDDLYATIAVFQDRQNGKRFVVGVVHLPADVETSLRRKDKTLRTLTWFSAFRNLKRRLNLCKREFDCVAALFVADFNINFKRGWTRVLVKTLAPLYTLTWRLLNFEGGTHGPRVIDATLIRGDMVVERSARLFEDDVSSDHRPYIEHLRYR